MCTYGTIFEERKVGSWSLRSDFSIGAFRSKNIRENPKASGILIILYVGKPRYPSKFLYVRIFI